MSHPLTPEILARTSAIVGRTGSGKSTTARGGYEELLRQNLRCSVVDPTGAHWGIRLEPDGETPSGLDVVIFGGDHADIPMSPDAGALIGGLVGHNEVPQSIVDISDFSNAEQYHFLTGFLESVYMTNKGALHLIVDEADLVAPQKPLPEQRRMLGAFNKIVRRGRIKGFRPMMITQRPAVIDKDVLGQASTLVAMQLTLPHDRKAVVDWITGQVGPEEAKETAGNLASLSPGQGFLFAPEKGIFQRAQFPMPTTFDSGRAPEIGEEERSPRPLSSLDLSAIASRLAPPEPDEEEESGRRPRKKRRRQTNDAATPKADARLIELERDFEDMKRRLAASEAKAQAAAKEVGHAIERAAKQMEPALAALGDAVKRLWNIAEGATRQPAPAPKPPKTKSPQPRPVENIDLGPEKKLLVALAGIYPAGFTEPQWATAAGKMKRTGGTWRTYRSRLKTAGFVEQRNKQWYATTEGAAAVGDVPRVPAAPSERIRWWQDRLGGGPAKLLGLVADEYPSSMTKTALADAAGLEESGGTYRTYLSKLSTNGLIDIDDLGMIRAADDLYTPLQPEL